MRENCIDLVEIPDDAVVADLFFYLIEPFLVHMLGEGQHFMRFLSAFTAEHFADGFVEITEYIQVVVVNGVYVIRYLSSLCS